MHCQPTALGEVAPECIREGGTGNGDPRHARVCSRDPARGILLLFGARHASVGESSYFSWLCGTRGACECIASPRRSGKWPQNAFAKAVPDMGTQGTPKCAAGIRPAEFCYCLELATPPLAILSIFSCFAALGECVNALPARGAQGSAPGMHFRRRSEKRPAGAPARWEPTKSKKADSAARFPTKCPGGT